MTLKSIFKIIEFFNPSQFGKGTTEPSSETSSTTCTVKCEDVAGDENRNTAKSVSRGVGRPRKNNVKTKTNKVKTSENAQKSNLIRTSVKSEINCVDNKSNNAQQVAVESVVKPNSTRIIRVENVDNDTPTVLSDTDGCSATFNSKFFYKKNDDIRSSTEKPLKHNPLLRRRSLRGSRDSTPDRRGSQEDITSDARSDCPSDDGTSRTSVPKRLHQTRVPSAETSVSPDIKNKSRGLG